MVAVVLSQQWAAGAGQWVTAGVSDEGARNCVAAARVFPGGWLSWAGLLALYWVPCCPTHVSPFVSLFSPSRRDYESGSFFTSGVLAWPLLACAGLAPGLPCLADQVLLAACVAFLLHHGSGSKYVAFAATSSSAGSIWDSSKGLLRLEKSAYGKGSCMCHVVCSTCRQQSVNCLCVPQGPVMQ